MTCFHPIICPCGAPYIAKKKEKVNRVRRSQKRAQGYDIPKYSTKEYYREYMERKERAIAERFAELAAKREREKQSLTYSPSTRQWDIEAHRERGATEP